MLSKFDSALFSAGTLSAAGDGKAEAKYWLNKVA